MNRPAPAQGMPDTTSGSGPTISPYRNAAITEWRALMKMIKSIVKKFKKNEDLANHAWVLHVI
ncbi:hypothetical protein [Kitasatospora brasiliensis]|uniref:hypothetical protein n=1 Tax=Kitasatospora brasiliensis TaxID=3058040 RepID=UPI00292FFA29|nr:hypothetical protein [Kitasatospora sp. K002]